MWQVPLHFVRIRIAMKQLAVSQSKERLVVETEIVVERQWARLLDTGCVAGRYPLRNVDGGHLELVYYGLANALPGSGPLGEEAAVWRGLFLRLMIRTRAHGYIGAHSSWPDFRTNGPNWSGGPNFAAACGMGRVAAC